MDESKGRTPFRTEDIEGNFTIRVDVGVVDLGNEAAVRWVKRVIRMKLNVQQEHATLIRGFIWSKNMAWQMYGLFTSMAQAEQFGGGSLAIFLRSFFIYLRPIGSFSSFIIEFIYITNICTS